MPRTACSECRSRKAKCFYGPIGERCERCRARDLRCSKVSTRMSPSRGHSFTTTNVSRGTPSGQRAISITPQIPAKHLPEISDDYHGVDVGHGTPAELLRESELTHNLILLYFENFSDIHFMYDQESFLRKYTLGETPKVILYSMMALGVRYLPSPFMEHIKRSHRGEALFQEARKLLKIEFDHPSVTTIQAYILMATYHLTFGGARKAWLHLGMACNMVKILRLTEDYWEPDPFDREMIHRLMCTVLLMDWTLSPSLNAPIFFPTSTTIVRPCSDEELKLIKSRSSISTLQSSPPSLVAEIFTLSRIFHQVCVYHRLGGTLETWQGLETQYSDWQITMHEDLIYTPTNMTAHLEKGHLRRFAWFHLLHHHVCQLIYFPFLQGSSHLGQDAALITLRAQTCHYHATRITDIVDEVWRTAKFDLHNVAVGQMLTVAAAVHTHACLTATSREQAEASRSKLTIIDKHFTRVRKHCRIFDRISSQVDAFFRICGQSTLPQSVFDKNQRLIRHILHYGTAYEQLNFKDGGQLGTLGSPTPSNHYTEEDNTPNVDNSHVAHTHLDWLTSNEMVDHPFEDFAWMYSLDSLNDLYSAPFADPLAGGL